MEFSTSDEMRKLLAELREYVDTQLMPLESQFMHLDFSALQPTLDVKREEVKKLGWWLPQIEEHAGGMGLSLMEFGMVAEVLARCPFAHYVFNCQAPDAGNMEILLKFGSDEQKEKFLKPLLKGEVRSCFSMTEPDLPGSNPTWMSTSAVKDGDDYVINGKKWFTTAADGAAFAVVMAVTNPDQAPHFRASQILVPTNTPGFKVERNTPCMGHSGDSWGSHSEITYNNCRVPQSNLLGQEGAGFMIAQERLGPGRIHHCMRWVGIAERCFDLMCQRATSRECAPGRTLSTRQIIQAWIAESRAEINAARLMVLQAAWMIDQVGQKEARIEVHVIKFYVAKVMMDVIDRAIQTHGALGITDYTPLSFFYRNERAARIYDGPDEVHKMAVSKRILQQYEGHTG